MSNESLLWRRLSFCPVGTLKRPGLLLQVGGPGKKGKPKWIWNEPWVCSPPRAKASANSSPLSPGSLPPGHDKLTCDVALALPTFTAPAGMAGVWRLWGGCHIRTENETELVCGGKIAEYSWPKYKEYLVGTARAR